jgi:hypothetical protein
MRATMNGMGMTKPDRSGFHNVSYRGAVGIGVGALGLALTPAGWAMAASGHAAQPAAVHHAVNHHYVTNSFSFGSDASSATMGFDLNGDHQVDNQLGKIVSALTGMGFDLPSAVSTSLTSGASVTLNSLRTTSLSNAKSASWLVLSGKPKAHPGLTGHGKFAVDRSVPSATKLSGRIKRGTFLGSGGTIPLRLGLIPGEPPIALKVVDAHLQAHCTASACTQAKLGGAITEKQVNSTIMPGLADFLTATVAQTCSAASPTTCSTTAQTIISLFDTNHDYVISTSEVKNNNIVGSLFLPDLDLFKANGHRGTDGKADSLSLGLGFTAVKASFKQP